MWWRRNSSLWPLTRSPRGWQRLRLSLFTVHGPHSAAMLKPTSMPAPVCVLWIKHLLDFPFTAYTHHIILPAHARKKAEGFNLIASSHYDEEGDSDDLSMHTLEPLLTQGWNSKVIASHSLLLFLLLFVPAPWLQHWGEWEWIILSQAVKGELGQPGYHHYGLRKHFAFGHPLHKLKSHFIVFYFTPTVRFSFFMLIHLCDDIFSIKA